ncbi:MULTISPECIES: hypothetical protein [Acidaminococcus]|nr:MULTISPECIES: hypothetical protein [Acidaminococcus]
MIEKLKAAAENFVFWISFIQAMIWIWKTTKSAKKKLRKLLKQSKAKK